MPLYRLLGKRAMWYEAEVEADSEADARELAEGHDVEWQPIRNDDNDIELDTCEEL